MAIRRLRARIQRYDWGSSDAIPRLFGVENSGGRPMAELWMGAHPSAPALIADGGDRGAVEAKASAAATADSRNLFQLISEEPEASLGSASISVFGLRLPFLLKLLSAERALSIQAHPDLAQAGRGFAAEEQRGIPVDGRERNYRDDNHKPELMCAVSEFWMLRGFRTRGELAEEFCDGSWPLGRKILTLLESDAPDESALSELFTALVGAGPAERAELVSAALRRAESKRSAAAESEATPAAARERVEARNMSDYVAPRYYWVSELARQYPGDIGVLAPLYLNCYALQPGEATFLSAGVLHAYLHGTGIEIMANSDNVLRGGLTSKHVDVAELSKVVSFVSGGPERAQPVELRSAAAGSGLRELGYRVPAKEFELRRAEAAGKVRVTVDRAPAPEIVFCAEGRFELTESVTENVAEEAGRSRNESVTLARGESAFVPASASALELSGSGVLYRAICPVGEQAG